MMHLNDMQKVKKMILNRKDSRVNSNNHYKNKGWMEKVRRIVKIIKEY